MNRALTGQVWQTDLDAIFGQVRISSQRLSLIQANLSNTTSDDREVLDGFVLLKNGENGLTNASPCWAFTNLCVAVLIYTIRYPAVFWYTHKGFTFLFSFQLLIAAILHLVTYCGASVVYKLQLNAAIFPGLDLILNHPTTLLLYTICNSLVFFSSMTVFKYGYSFYKQQYLATTKNCHASFLKRLHDQHSTCHGYVPHVTAMMVMLVSTLCKIPLVYNYVHVYLKTGDVLILACIILEAIYLFFWIILWLFFTIKQSWEFHVSHSRIGQSKASIYTIQNSHVNEMQQGQGLTIEETANREDEREKLNATESSIDFDRMSNDTELMGAMEQADEASTATDSNRDSPSDQGTQTGALRKKIKQRKNMPQKVTFGAVTSSPPRKPPRTQRCDVTDNQSHSSLDGKLRIVAQVHECDSNRVSDKSAPQNALGSSNHKMSRHSYDPTNTSSPGLTQTTLNPHSNYLHMGGVPSNISSNPNGASTSNVNPKDNVLITIKNSDQWSPMAVSNSGSNYRDVQIVPQKGKPDIGRRDSANFSLTSSQETSSNNSDPPALSTQV